MPPTASAAITDFGAVADGVTDNSDAIDRALETVNHGDYATVYIPDGVFGIRLPLRLGHHVSLHLAPSARLLALPNFQGEAMITKGEGKPLDQSGPAHGYGGRIAGGILDANRQDLIGIDVHWARRFIIHDMEIINARREGIHLGRTGWYETTIRTVRIALAHDCSHLPGSVGLHIEKCSDNQIHQVLIIGYETGIWAKGSSTAFNQVHVWNWGANRPLRCAFHAAGWQDTYSQCQADSPEEVGFRVDAPFQRFDGCWIQTGWGWAAGKVVGVEITPRGTHGTFIGMYFSAPDDTPMAKGFDGTLEAATILGCQYTQAVHDGRINQLSSDTGGKSHVPPLALSQGALQLGEPAPHASHQRPGESRGVALGAAHPAGPSLYIRAAEGWKRMRVE